MIVSERIQRIKPSPTLTMSQKARELQAAGIDIINFSAGEPDFDTPNFIKEATIMALKAGFTKYTAVGGIPELQKAICHKFKRDNSLEYATSEVTCTCGAKEALFAAFQILLNPGDEVIIPAPYWVSYPDQVLLSDGIPVFIETSDALNFKITPTQLKSAITPKTKALVLNSPSNPCGAIYSKEELKALVDICIENNIWMISDDIYEVVRYDDIPFENPVTVNPAAKSLTIIVNGLSKSHAMTGWRFGYVAAPKEIISQMNKWLSQVTSNVTSFVQSGAVAALMSERSAESDEMLSAFAIRRKILTNGLNAIKGISCQSPDGAFYCFPNVGGLYGKIHNQKRLSNSSDVAEFLLQEAKVATVPGEAFGLSNYIRFSFANATEQIEEGIRRVRSAVNILV